MRGRFSPNIFLAVYALAIPLALGVVALWSPLGEVLKSSNAAIWPAWVQAVGSIAAIASGFLVVAAQNCAAQDRDAALRADTERADRALAFMLASVVSSDRYGLGGAEER